LAEIRCFFSFGDHCTIASDPQQAKCWQVTLPVPLRARAAMTFTRRARQCPCRKFSSISSAGCQSFSAPLQKRSNLGHFGSRGGLLAAAGLLGFFSGAPGISVFESSMTIFDV